MRNITSPAVHGFIFIIGFPFVLGFPSLLVIYILLILYRLLRHRYRTYLRVLDVRFLRNLFYAIFVFTLLLLIYTNSDDKGTQMDLIYFGGLFFLLPGIVFHTISRRMWNRLELRHSRYDELLMEDKLTHIQQFADRMLIHPNYIRNDFRYLIVSGELDNVYFDEKTDQVFIREEDLYEDEYDDEDEDDDFDLDLDEDFNDDDSDDLDHEENNSEKSKVAASEPPPPPPPTQSPKKIRCSSCGAPTVLRPNEYTSCKYCGTPISYN